MGETVTRGRPRSEDHLDEIAVLAARGVPLAEVARELALTYRQVLHRTETLRRILSEQTDESAWLDRRKRTVVDVARQWCALRGLEPRPPEG